MCGIRTNMHDTRCCKRQSNIQRYDFCPPNMSPPDLSSLFPHAVPGDPWTVQWPYLRAEAPHIWRFDERHKGYVTGNASAEEAACLFTFASQFSGKRGLEVGTYYGWTAAHLVAAGLRLDCIDPALADPEVNRDVRAALDNVPCSGGYRLWPAPSPNCISAVCRSVDEPWSFAFIDGNHDGDAPRLDAEAVLPHMALNSMVVFHDMLSPHVEAGLAVFRGAGFTTALVNTMQILGVAWRGNVTPPCHVADINVPSICASHLSRYDLVHLM